MSLNSIWDLMVYVEDTIEEVGYRFEESEDGKELLEEIKSSLLDINEILSPMNDEIRLLEETVDDVKTILEEEEEEEEGEEEEY